MRARIVSTDARVSELGLEDLIYLTQHAIETFRSDAARRRSATGARGRHRSAIGPSDDGDAIILRDREWAAYTAQNGLEILDSVIERNGVDTIVRRCRFETKAAED